MYALKIPVNKLHLRHRPFEPVSSLSAGFAGGVNFGMFSRSSKHPEGSYPVGASIQEGKIAHNVVASGWPALQHQNASLFIGEVWGLNPAYVHTYKILAQAGPRLLRNGAIITDYTGFADTQPGIVTRRIAAGILDDKHVIIMARECTMVVMAEWAKTLGCRDALGGDGGSSAQVVMDGALVWGNPQLVSNALCWEDCEILVRPQAEAPRVIQSSDVRVMLNLRHFEPWEHACPHCNGILITKEAVEVMHRLDALRSEFGTPIGIVPKDRSLARGFTCVERGGHSPNSRHYPPHGDARDISALSRPQSMLRPLVEKYFGEGGIGVYSWGYHVDLGPKRRW